MPAPLLGRLSQAIRAKLLERIGFRGARAPAAAREGRFAEATYAGPAGSRLYKTYVPLRGEGKPRPLLVLLHGCKQTPDDFAAGTRMNELADELGFVVAYPQQARLANPQRCWNWFLAADQQRDRGEPAILAGLTKEVMARHGIDPDRVFVAGLSAGGAMAAIMAHTYPDLYAAVGIHSGLAYASARDLPSALAAMRGEGPVTGELPGEPRHAVPTIVFHGDDDTTVHPSNADWAIAPAAAGKKVESGEARGLSYTRTVQPGDAGKPVAEHWVVHGAGHAWSGGSIEGSYADPRGPDASREMLRFFLSL